MKLSTNSARACLALTLPFKAWSVDTVTNCSGFPGLSGFLGCGDVELSMLKPGKSVANLGESITVSADQQYWRQPGSFFRNAVSGLTSELLGQNLHFPRTP